MIFNVEWVNPEKKPDKEGWYPITVHGVFEDRISSALWFDGHWWKGGEVLDKYVLRWLRGLEPWQEPKKERRSKQCAL